MGVGAGAWGWIAMAVLRQLVVSVAHLLWLACMAGRGCLGSDRRGRWPAAATGRVGLSASPKP